MVLVGEVGVYIAGDLNFKQTIITAGVLNKNLYSKPGISKLICSSLDSSQMHQARTWEIRSLGLKEVRTQGVPFDGVVLCCMVPFFDRGLFTTLYR